MDAVQSQGVNSAVIKKNKLLMQSNINTAQNDKI